MKKKNGEKIIYSLNVNDIQEVANEFFERKLNKKELALVQDSVGDYIDWFQAIGNAIIKHIKR